MLKVKTNTDAFTKRYRYHLDEYYASQYFYGDTPKR